jgi:hypothetical protein
MSVSWPSAGARPTVVEFWRGRQSSAPGATRPSRSAETRWADIGVPFQNSKPDWRRSKFESQKSGFLLQKSVSSISSTTAAPAPRSFRCAHLLEARAWARGSSSDYILHFSLDYDRERVYPLRHPRSMRGRVLEAILKAERGRRSRGGVRSAGPGRLGNRPPGTTTRREEQDPGAGAPRKRCGSRAPPGCLTA